MGNLRMYNSIIDYNNDPIKNNYNPNVCYIKNTDEVIYNSYPEEPENINYDGVDENNTISLPNNLENGEYTLVYEYSNGIPVENFSEIGKIYV